MLTEHKDLHKAAAYEEEKLISDLLPFDLDQVSYYKSAYLWSSLR